MSKNKKNAIPSLTGAVMYTRVSSKEQQQEGFSLDAQPRLLREYARQNDMTIVAEFCDVETAKRAGRAEFSDMVALLKRKARSKANDATLPVILAEKTDRLYRNLKDWVSLDELGVVIHFVKENTVVSPDSRSSEKFMHGIKVLMAKNYIENLGEEASKGMLEKARQGYYPSQAPTGYINVECDKRKFIQPDPETKDLVRHLFEWYSTGQYTLKEATRKANELGLRTRGGGRVQSALVHKLLRNPIYYGDFYWKEELYEGKHEPLVSKDLWDKVQAVMNGRSGHDSRLKTHDWLFRGLVHCGHCGGVLSAERKKEKYVYYHCTGNGECRREYVPEAKLEAAFIDALREMQMTPDVFYWLTCILKSSRSDEKKDHEAAMARLHAEYTKVQSRLGKLYDDLCDGTISRDVYDAKKAEYMNQQATLRHRIEAHEHADRRYVEEGEKFLELASHALRNFQHGAQEDRRNLLKTVFSNSIWRDGRLYPEYRKPLNLVVSVLNEVKTPKIGTATSLSEGDRLRIWLPGLVLTQTFSRKFVC